LKIVICCLLLAVAGFACLCSSGVNVSASRAAASNKTSADQLPQTLRDKQQLNVQALTARLPLSFEQNVGQFDARANFTSRGAGYHLFLTATGAVMELRKTNSEVLKKLQTESASSQRQAPARPERSLINLRLQGANSNAKPVGVDELRERRNYFIGNDPGKWRTDVPTFRAVRYDEVYPGISLTYYGNQQQLEYDFTIRSGADPRCVRMSFGPAAQPQVSASGELILRTREGEVRQQKPIIYQEVDGRRQLIEGRYVLIGKRQVGFEIGSYDRTSTLVIDPTLVYSTYLGGGGDDLGSSIALDNNNNVYIAGTTSSLNFPLQDPAVGANAGLADIFVTKIDASGGSIVYSTYVGGSGLDRGDGIAVDNNGNAYVVGRVDSSSIDFPTTPGSFASSYRGGDFDGVVFKLNGQGNALVYSAFLGGEENDSAEGVAVDAAGNAYVTGGTKSVGFPTTGNAYQGSRGGDTDAFLTKINAAGSSLLYSTYLGGSGTDRGSAVVIDGNGNAYLAGYSGSADFPTENAFQNNFGGSFDAFVAQINTNVSGFNSLVLCSYLGGAGDDKAFGIAMDSSASNLFVVGQTSSSNFPVFNPVQATSGGGFDAFVAKISTAGAKIYATYLGGNGDDRGTGIAVNSVGATYVTGFTSSANFPTVSPLQGTRAGGSDAFLTKLDATGSTLLYSTYFGGSANESSASTVTATNPLALDSLSNAYLTGYTASNNFPTAAPLQATNAGGASDAFLVKIADTGVPADFTVTVSPANRLITPGDLTTYDVTVTPSGGFVGLVNLSVSGLPANAGGAFNPSSLSINSGAAASATLTVSVAPSTPFGPAQLMITGTSGSLQHTVNAGLNVANPASADVSVTMTASPNPPIVGFDLTYRLVVGNNGPASAPNVHVTDSLPLTTFVSATPSQGMCTGTGPLDCDLGTLAKNATAIITVVVRPFTQGNISTTATVSSGASDPEGANNNAGIMSVVQAAGNSPTMLDPNLTVTTVVTGLSQPTSMAFIGTNDFLVLEKDTGRVRRVTNGALQSTVLDLAVNSASERGLLGIALHPNFNINRFVYLYWTESSTGVDSSNLADVPLLGNRVDRYVWNGSTLTFDRNLIKLRSYQADPNQPLRGNHNGGVLRFGPDGKLFILMGDNGRRGFLQNVTSGGTVPDDQYGGPEPDNAHLTGFILRLNDGGTTPADNPFYNATTNLTGEAAANIKKLYTYGVRNGFGLAFDPLSGNLWDQENGDDAFDEMNRVTAGSNNGWVQMMGPMSRVAQFKQIESTYGAGNLQQLRWPPSLIADTPQDALSRLYMLPGAHYNEPEFSWKYPTPAAPLGFVQGRGLGPQFEGDMFVGAARTFLDGGFLFRFKLTSDRLHFAFTDPRLTDLVADNLDKFDITESESLLIGKDFGITTDIETGPNGDLYVVSNTNSSVYEISGKQPTLFVATLNGAQETPPNSSTSIGTATLLLSPDEATARVSLNFSGLSSAQTAAHIHGPGGPGVSAPILFPLPNGNVSDFLVQLAPGDVQNLKNGLLYVNVHTTNFTNGEIRGQLNTSANAASFQFSSATYMSSEGAGAATITVTRLGDPSRAVSVGYSTSDGTASQQSDYVRVSGFLGFAIGETSKTFSVPLIDDVYADGSKTIGLTLTSAVQSTDLVGKAFLGSPSTAVLTITDNDFGTATTNPLDDSTFFVNQHYLDLLNRQPDLPGLAYWTNEIVQCGNDLACANNKRINVSAAFFIESEFQQTGGLVYRAYKAALGRDPTYDEFSVDRNNVDAFLSLDLPNRPEFQAKYQNTNFVAALVQTAQTASGVDLTAFINNEEQKYMNCINLGPSVSMCQGEAVKDLANYPAFAQAVYKPSFVLMQYFGYLRRDADPAGYAFWLNVLNNRDPNNYRGMVCSFITSAEYQQRFSPVVTHANSECAGVH